MTLGETLPHSAPAEPIVLLGETQGSWLKPEYGPCFTTWL